MRFLFITYYLPPEGTTAAQRIWRWVHALYQHGHEISAIGKSNPKLQALEKRPLPPGHYLRTVALDYRLIQSTQQNTPVIPANHTGWLRKIMDSFPWNLAIGEGGILWIILAYFKAIKSIRTHQPDCLITSYRPAADHIIGYLIKIRFPEITWIADFRDMPPLNTQQVFFAKWQFKFWNSLLKKANQITAVSEGIASQLQIFNPNTFVLYNAAYPNHSEIVPRPELPWPIQNLTLLYTGSWFPNQSLEPLLKAIKSLNHYIPKIQVVYCGKDGAIWKSEFARHQLQDSLITLGQVDATIAQHYQKKAHVNLLFTWKNPQSKGILTSKLFDYLSHPTPLLCITKGSTDPELQEITRNHPSILLADDDTPNATIVKWLKTLMNPSSAVKKKNTYTIPALLTWQGQINPWLKTLP